jgi:calcineurin-like phosphoesterase family protein
LPLKNTYFTSDFHLGHKNILKYTNRGFDCIHEMDDYIISQVNDLPDGSTLWHLGDFTFKKMTSTIDYIERMKSTIELKFILGNHDASLAKNVDRFNKMENVEIVGHYHEIRIDNQQKLILFHYPITSFNGMYRGSIHFHGHCHGNLTETLQRRKDVGIDCTEMKIKSFEELIEDM